MPPDTGVTVYLKGWEANPQLSVGNCPNITKLRIGVYTSEKHRFTDFFLVLKKNFQFTRGVVVNQWFVG